MKTFPTHRVLVHAAACATVFVLACMTSEDSGKGSKPVETGDALADAATETSDAAPGDGAQACRCLPETGDCQTLDGSVFPYECDCPLTDLLPTGCFRVIGVMTVANRLELCCKEPPAP